MLRNFIVAALAAPLFSYAQSSVNIGGGVVMGYKHTPSKSNGAKSVDGIDNLEAAGSNVTIRAVEDIGDGYKVNVLLNHRFDPSTGAQTGISYFTNSKIGLSGSFGEVSMGKMWGPVDELLRRSLDVYMPLGLGVNVYGGPLDAPTRYNGTLMYMSPEVAGFKVSAAVVPKGNMQSKRQNTTEIAALYRQGAFKLGVGFTQNAGKGASASDNFKDRDVLTVGARYDFEKIHLGLTLSKVSAPGRVDDSERYSLGARYLMSNKMALKLGYEYLNVNHGDKSRMFAVGGEYRLSKQTMIFSEVGRMKSDIASRNDRGFIIMAGIAHRF